jgi:hypothetical protein
LVEEIIRESNKAEGLLGVWYAYQQRVRDASLTNRQRLETNQKLKEMRQEIM